MKVHLVDGTYELFRMFYGAPSATTPDGREVAATRAFLRNVIALLSAPGVTHVAIAFDTVIESFRNDLFPGYKTGAGIDPKLWAQFPLVERASEALGVVTWRMIEFEADDALATAAVRFAEDPRVEQVLVCSPDKDLTQVVRGERVIAWDRRRDVRLGEDGVREKFGVGPASIPDYLALVGDSADGIPGIPKWGPKAASSLLARFGRIEDIPDDPSAWGLKVRGADALAESLRARREDAVLYRRLATLRLDVPLAEDLDALEHRGADRDALERLAAELADEEIVRRVPRWR